MRYGMVIDLRRCVGCNSCSVACKQTNATPAGVLRTKVQIDEEGKYPNTRLSFTPFLCMHCENPECARVCPTGATQKLDNGIVTIDKDKCIGCQYCVMACPYYARTFVKKVEQYFPGQEITAFEEANSTRHQDGVVDKCDFCIDRINTEKQPSCVGVCAAKARIFGDLDDPNSEVSKLIVQRGGFQLLEALGFSPAVYYIR
ncbi:MAG: 4Fe-4S ferredoxin [Gracilibacter sp. BRH_c7a]|nr:MAG: 4Fe-4S ferredoxin [Gracilibacter sp. BRH_c7a]